MLMERFCATLICNLAKVVTGVRAVWRENTPNNKQRVYFANHSSHGDFVLIWASLPAALRYTTRPVARADYWLRGPLRRYVAERVFRGVLISTLSKKQGPNPLEQMSAALAQGDSLIVFPEGTRNSGEGLLPFKSGLYHLAKAYPETEFIPVWIENLGRVMPKGTLIPVPLLCSLSFGQAIRIAPEDNRVTFLERARDALLSLAPAND